eukprot:223546-Prymnesium_polylepis.1
MRNAASTGRSPARGGAAPGRHMGGSNRSRRRITPGGGDGVPMRNAASTTRSSVRVGAAPRRYMVITDAGPVVQVVKGSLKQYKATNYGADPDVTALSDALVAEGGPGYVPSAGAPVGEMLLENPALLKRISELFDETNGAFSVDDWGSTPVCLLNVRETNNG